MFGERVALDRRFEASLDALTRWREAGTGWFDGSPGSVDRRIAECRAVQSGLRSAAATLGTDRGLQFLAAGQELEADRRDLEGLRRDLLTAGADREDAPPLRVKEVIRHGDYHNEREEEFPSTFDGFLGFLAGSPYAAAGDHSKNKWVAKAWEDLQSKGASSLGWADFRVAGAKIPRSASRWVEAQAREFFREQAHNAGPSELAERARRHASALTSTLPAGRSAALVAAFVRRVAQEMPDGSESPSEEASARYVLDFMRARGVDQLTVDDENPSPSYQRDFDDEEDLDHAVAWVPPSVIHNPGGRGARAPWNPVIRRQDLEDWLAGNKPGVLDAADADEDGDGARLASRRGFPDLMMHL